MTNISSRRKRWMVVKVTVSGDQEEIGNIKILL